MIHTIQSRFRVGTIGACLVLLAACMPGPAPATWPSFTGTMLPTFAASAAVMTLSPGEVFRKSVDVARGGLSLRLSGTDGTLLAEASY